MNREQLVGITGQRVQTDGGREVLVEGYRRFGRCRLYLCNYGYLAMA